MAGILGTATSGLLAFQRALTTVGHNIANANTPGYSRQRVQLETREPQFTGGGYIGAGVSMAGIERVYDQFLTDGVRRGTATTTQLQTYQQYSARVSNLMADPDAGLDKSLESFFNAVHGVSNDPASVPARQLMLSEGELLADRFHYLDDQLSAVRSEVNGQLASMTSEVSSLSASIADLNREIVAATGRAGVPPNDLLDQRDQLLNELSGLVSVKTASQDDGAVNVFIGNGQALVTGGTSATLTVVQNQYDARDYEIAYQVGNNTSVVTRNITGGRLGGLLEFKRDILDPTQNDLGRVGASLAAEFNAQHAQGVDLDGNLGGDFFSLPAPEVLPSTYNSGGGSVTASFDPAATAGLTGDDYLLSYDGSNYSLTRVADGSAVALTGSGTGADPFRAEGLQIVAAGAAAGDSFLIRPTRPSAGQLAVSLTNVRGIAAAAPVAVGEATDANGLPLNQGSAALTYTGVDNSFTPLGGAIDLVYDAANQRFDYSGAASGSFNYDPATDSGNTFTVAGVSIRINDAPADGDSFSIQPGNGAAGDNSNALLLAGLQTDLTMAGGNASFQDSYGQMIADAATKARKAEISAQAQETLLEQAQVARDAVSGVNLDEEAADLLRYQQAYQAMAQVVTVADNMFQTLLGAFRR